MEKIDSFKVDHMTLLPGIYISREDVIGGEKIVTYDIRMKRPNFEPVMNTAELHTIEHIGATFLRNSKEYSKDVVYFGPMGCRTGFYLILSGEVKEKDAKILIKEMISFVSSFEGEVPGASAIECGNYLDMNLPMAKYECNKFQSSI